METYLDYNATTPLDPKVFEEMKPFLEDQFGNASSFHKKGQTARNAVELAREKIAQILEVEPADVVFTSGGTEANNLAVMGTLDWLAPQKKHLVISSIEHQSVLHQAQHLMMQGYEISMVPVDGGGVIDLDFIKRVVTHKTALVSIMHVNNEVGSIQPIEEVAKIAHECDVLFHTDAVQSFGKIALTAESGPDLISISAHKICGPKGVGALFIRKGLKLKPILHGGHQEKNIRPGTENVAAIAGFGAASELAQSQRSEESKRVGDLRKRLEEGIFKKIPAVRLNQHANARVYNTLNVSFEGLDGETLLMNLDLKNIYVSTGSACTAGSVEPSHVLLAMGIPEKMARAAIRFSPGRFTTKEDIDIVLHELPLIVERLRKSSTQKAPL